MGNIELIGAIEAVAESLQYISAQITRNLLNKPDALTQKNVLSSTTKVAAELEVSPAPDAFSEHAKPESVIHLTKRQIEV